MVDSATQLGRVIGGLAKQQSSIRENLSPRDANAQFNIVNSESFIISGSLTATKIEITGVFTVYHPVYGIVGSTGERIYFPLVLGHTIRGLLGSGYLSSATDLESTSLLYEVSF